MVVAGAFQGGRRAACRVVFHCAPGKQGRFDLLGYAGRIPDIAIDFSQRAGEGAAVDGPVERPLAVRAGVVYRMVAEAWPAPAEAGGRWWLRARFYREQQREPPDWLVIADHRGLFAADEGLGVALFAHYSQVEFGETIVQPLVSPCPLHPEAPWPTQ